MTRLVCTSDGVAGCLQLNEKAITSMLLSEAHLVPSQRRSMLCRFSPEKALI